MGDQRRSSWPWRKLKSSSTTAKSGDKSSRFSPSQLVSPASSFKANESARFLENLSQEATTTFVEDGRLLEANALREKAEEGLQALKQELSIVMREVMAKEALVKQHQKVADEAMSGWEKAEKDVLSLKQDLESAAQQKIILEDRIVEFDGALKECMRQVRHVRDEQQGKIQEAITCKTREWEQIKAELEAKQAELQRRLMESDAQNSAMTKSLQERARKILEANEAKSKTETELKVAQVKLGSSEKDISALQYELHLLSKELEIRNEEVVFCKKSADIAHKQHLDNVQKVAKLEAECYRLRTLIKKKLPGPAAIAQMRKEVEGLPQIRDSNSATAELKRRPNTSYASSTISFTNSHQRAGIASSINRDVESLRERLFSMEEENKLLKEALSKRIGELQTSWVLCAKTANKLSIAEDQLESLQGTPRGTIMNGSEFNFTTTREPSIASVTDENGFGGNEHDEEASCAESWASALIGELAHFRKEKITTKEAIKEVTESYKTKESLSSLQKGSVLHAKEDMVLDKEECPVNAPLPEAEQPANLEMANPLAHQDGQLQALSLLCKDLDHKLSAIEEQLRPGRESKNEEPSATDNLVKESVISLVDAAHQKFSELEKAIQGMGSMSVQSIPYHAAGIAAATTPSSELRLDVEMPTCRASNNSTIQEMDPMPLQANSDHLVAVVASCTSICEGDESRQGATILTPTVMAVVADEEEQFRLAVPATSISVEPDESKLSELISGKDQNRDSIAEDKQELGSPINLDDSLGFVICKLVELLGMLAGGATLDADCAGGKTEEQWEQEKEGLVACKDRFLVGQSSVLELLVRVGMVVCRACHVGASELEDLLASLKKNADVHVNAAGALMPRQHQEAKQRDELDAHVAELGRQLADVQREKEKLGEERDKEVALHSEVKARCEELQQKLQGFELQEDRSAVKLSHGEDTKLSKESELVEAKEKLAECERTMVVLGKQLHSLSSLKQPPPPAHTPLQPRHHPHYHNGPHYADVDHQGTQIYEPPRPRGRKLPCHVVSGPQDTDQYRRFFQQSGPVHVAHTQQMKARRRDAASWQQQQPEEEYSPPLSAMSSPARSPARYVQQVSGRRASVVRTSLTQSLDAVAAGTTKPGTSFGKLFSRSKQNR